jgi:hypothetical protein
LLKSSSFLFRPLREEVVREAHRSVAIAYKLLDDAVIVRVVLKASACVDADVSPRRFISRMK